MKLKNKIVLITGGNSGIGLATAKLFHAEGAKVIITARSDKTYHEAKESLGSTFDIIQTDVTDNKSLDALFDHVNKTYGHLDVLFANAGVSAFAPVASASVEQFDFIFNTNVKALFFTVQKALPFLRDGSSVILTSSVLGEKGIPNSSIYSATKAAVRSFARSWTAEIPATKIRFNVLSPGPIETPLWGKSGAPKEHMDAMSKQMAETIPMKRFGKDEEIAKAALFLASDDSSYMAGSNFLIDGGIDAI